MNPTALAFNIIVVLILALVFFLMLSLIVFQFYNFDLGDAWAFSGSIFGGMTTLAAAYIASKLYDDWRNPHNLNIETEHKKDILKIIRKIKPLEYKYDRLLSNHFIYKCAPDRTFPISLNDDELSQLTEYINELLSLLDELHLITKDVKIKNLLDHYYNYAQLYNYILVRSNFLYSQEDKSELIEFLRTNLKFDFIDIENKNWSSSTLYAYAFKGIENSKIRKYISESLKTSSE